MIDQNALSHWFPPIRDAGLPVPKTHIVRVPDTALQAIAAAMGGEEVIFSPKPFFDDLATCAADLGFPCFLRTDHTSGKHEWSRTCFLKSAEDIPSHVFALAEYSEMVDMIGLPWSTWAVRELLPTIPVATCPHYEGMPVCREFRVFVDGARVACLHPYWPRKALTQGGAAIDDAIYERLCALTDIERFDLHCLAASVGDAVGGAWSVDILETRRGWMVTDMALAARSWHWPDCPHAKGVGR